jgi:dihydroflavonol-4-reductase
MADLVLVTGATGFIGSKLCCKLLAEGYRVRALTRKTSSLIALKGLPPRARCWGHPRARELDASFAGMKQMIHFLLVTLKKDLVKPH